MAKKDIVDVDQNDTSELEKKLASHDNIEAQATDQEIIKPRRSEISNVAKEKLEAMSKYSLKPATVRINAELELEEDFHFTIIAKKFGRDKQELCRQYVLECIERDMKKIGIFEHKK